MMLDVMQSSSFLERKKESNRRIWLNDFNVTWQDAGSKVGGMYLWMFSSEVVRVVLNLTLPLRVRF